MARDTSHGMAFLPHTNLLYDVDPESKVTLPMLAGEHGGVMDLFFAKIDYDPGAFGEIYGCHWFICVPTFHGHLSRGESQ